MDKPSLSVRGVALLEVPPDLARFTVSVSSRHAGRQAALELLSERSDSVRAILDGAGDAIERRDSGGFHLWPEADSDGVNGYTGTVTTSVTVNDFVQLGDLMVRLALLDECHVVGPYWELREGNTHSEAARRHAVRDGLNRARQYAASLGAELDTLLDLTDCDTGAITAPPPDEHAGLPSFDVDLRPLTVQATVQLRVTITTPDLTV